MATVDTAPTSGWMYDVVDEIATRTGRDATDLPPFSHDIEVDALTALIDDARADAFSVTFEYYGHVVEVDGSGAVEIEPKEMPTTQRQDE